MDAYDGTGTAPDRTARPDGLSRRTFLHLGGAGVAAVGLAALPVGPWARSARAAVKGVNLFPQRTADTSAGTWAFQAFVASGAVPALRNNPVAIGSLDHSITAVAASSASISVQPVDRPAATAGTAYSALASLRSPRSGTATVQLVWYGSGGTYLGQNTGPVTTLASGVLGSMTVSATAPAGTVAVGVRANVYGSLVAGDTVDFGAFEVAATAGVTAWTAGTGAAVQPSGTGYRRLQDVDPSGSIVNGKWVFGAVGTLQGALNACTNGDVLSLPPNCVVGIAGFENGYYAGVCIGPGDRATGCGGIQGTDLTSVVQPVKMSASTDEINVGRNGIKGTNPLALINLSGTSAQPLTGSVLKHFTLRGTSQDTYYNGIVMAYCTRAVVWGLLLRGASPGFSNSPPGETFGIGTNHAPDCLISHTEVDGRDSSGTPVCASPIGWNNTVNTVDFVLLDTVNLHDALTGHLTFWQTTNITTRYVTVKRNGTGHGAFTGHGINHEQSNGKIRHNLATIVIAFSTTGNRGRHLSLQNYSADMPDVQVTLATVDSFDHTAPDGGGAFSVAINDYLGPGNTQMVTTLPTIRIVSPSTVLTPYDDAGSTAACTPSTGYVRYHLTE